MINKVMEYINKYSLLNKDLKVVLAVSGGVDSMCLLDILIRLNYQVIIAHVNHNVRKESLNEMNYLHDFALKKNIPFECIILDKIENDNFHDKARKLRYDFFTKIAIKYNTSQIATAHHADDNIETILMKLTRGSNLYGYSGINKCIKNNQFNVVRPLLPLTKDELYNYAKENNITYFEDISNTKDYYTRNRYRHNVIPLLKVENPNIYETFNAFSNQVLEAFNYIRKESLKIKDISINDFNNLDEAIRHDYICLILEKEKITPNYNKIIMIDEFLSKNLPNSTLDIGCNKVIKTIYNHFIIEEKKDLNDFYYEINDFGMYEFDEFNIYLGKNCEKTEDKSLKICYNDLVFPIVIRKRKNGDTLDMPFGHKKLKDFLIDKKIPIDLRNSLPVIVNGNGKILGIPGILNTKFNIDDPIYLMYKLKEGAKNDK